MSESFCAIYHELRRVAFLKTTSQKDASVIFEAMQIIEHLTAENAALKQRVEELEKKK
jgi:DNA-binding GntR family transcriptional regulator